MAKKPNGSDPPLRLTTPRDLRAAELVAGDERFLVLSHAIDDVPAPTTEVLTDAESHVVRLVMRGMSNEEIAVERGASPRTVANQLASIYRKLGVTSRVELATYLGAGRSA